MLKPQDYAILLKLLAHYKQSLPQRQLAEELGISLAEINAGVKRLKNAGLLRSSEQSRQLVPVRMAAAELLVHGIKYLFPGKLGHYTRGMPTSVGAPIFQDKIMLGEDPIPVWPDANGESKGLALEPIHPAIPGALHKHPDAKFYEWLVLVDALRQGRAREREIAERLIRQRLK